MRSSVSFLSGHSCTNPSATNKEINLLTGMSKFLEKSLKESFDQQNTKQGRSATKNRQGVRALLMWGASATDGACVCSCTRMPHQQQTHPTSAEHAHPAAPHHAATKQAQ
nr:hypothetical protein CFP56_44178 [Quercus suber]